MQLRGLGNAVADEYRRTGRLDLGRGGCGQGALTPGVDHRHRGVVEEHRGVRRGHDLGVHVGLTHTARYGLGAVGTEVNDEDGAS